MTTTTTAAPPATRSQVRVLVVACLILFVDGYDLFTVGTIGPSLLRDPSWGATGSTLGTLGAATALGMPLGSVLAGSGADRWGRRTPMVVAVTWISATMLVSAIVPNLNSLVAVRFCTGIGIGALVPLVSAYVTDGAPARRRTLHLAIALGSMGVGGAASALLGRLILPGHHFQTVFLIGALSIILVPFIWSIVPANAVGRTSERERMTSLFVPSSRRATVLFWIAAFMSMALVYSTTAWLPTVMIKNGYNLNSSLEFLIAFTIGASFGSMAMAVFADRGYLKFVTFGLFALSAVAMLVLSSNQPRPLLLVVSALAGLGSLGCQGMVIAYISAFYAKRNRATSLGLALGVGRIGAIVGPLYLSVVTATIASPRAGFYGFMVPAIFGAVAVVFLPRLRATAADQG
ncbi:MFS transporter [Spirillospora sp. NPDC048819]|uniref:MFS transporter n=1 Tax=Spirillospora sp. NPDC048819 TaxID=3155268 RepID=UPI0033DEA1A7